jgi:hypothetical protein
MTETRVGRDSGASGTRLEESSVWGDKTESQILSTGGVVMKIWLFCFALIALVPFTAAAAGDLVTFNGGIGVDPVQGTMGTAPHLVVVPQCRPGCQPARRSLEDR